MQYVPPEKHGPEACRTGKKLDQTESGGGHGVNVKSAPLPILVWQVSVGSVGSSLPFVNSQKIQAVRVYYVFAALASRPFRFVWPWV